MELVQALGVAWQCQARQELLDGGIACPDGQKDEFALCAADAGIGHQVGAFVDGVQTRGGRRVCGHGCVLG